MDGGASVVLYSENPAELSSWYGAIKERIEQLLDQSVRKINNSAATATQVRGSRVRSEVGGLNGNVQTVISLGGPFVEFESLK